MTKREFIDVYGEKVLVDWDNKKLCAYNNKGKKIEYNIAKVTDSDITFYTDVVVDGVVTDVSERLNCGGAPVKQLYSKMVGYNATDNDPERTLWNKIVEYAKANEEHFFDGYGDFKHFNLKEQKRLMEIFKNL